MRASMIVAACASLRPSYQRVNSAAANVQYVQFHVCILVHTSARVNRSRRRDRQQIAWSPVPADGRPTPSIIEELPTGAADPRTGRARRQRRTIGCTCSVKQCDPGPARNFFARGRGGRIRLEEFRSSWQLGLAAGDVAIPPAPGVAGLPEAATRRNLFFRGRSVQFVGSGRAERRSAQRHGRFRDLKLAGSAGFRRVWMPGHKQPVPLRLAQVRSSQARSHVGTGRVPGRCRAPSRLVGFDLPRKKLDTDCLQHRQGCPQRRIAFAAEGAIELLARKAGPPGDF